jgi:hypothetical protein
MLGSDILHANNSVQEWQASAVASAPRWWPSIGGRRDRHTTAGSEKLTDATRTDYGHDRAAFGSGGCRLGNLVRRMILERLSRRIGRRLPTQVDLGLRDLAEPTPYSCHLTGCFDFSGGQITGWAKNTIESHDRDRSLLVAVVWGRHVISSVSVGEESYGAGWRFAIETGSQVTGSDILYERVRVLVRDALGGVQALRPEGTTQLALIRALITDAAPPLVEIDFREGGNSSMFTMEGWSGQEKLHRWTDGTQSTLAIALPQCEFRCDLELLVRPFTVPDRLDLQRLQILVSETPVARFDIAHQSILRCPIPISVLSGSEPAIIRFTHPDAASPASFGVSDDPRLLALAFKRMKIVPVAAGAPECECTIIRADLCDD